MGSMHRVVSETRLLQAENRFHVARALTAE
jgi:hypothetical protein